MIICMGDSTSMNGVTVGRTSSKYLDQSVGSHAVAMHRQAPLKVSAGGASIHDMALQLLQYYTPAGKTASLAVTPRSGSLYYLAQSINPKKTLPPAPLLENRRNRKRI